MGFIQKYIKKFRNMFHIPGEDVIILGLDDRNKTARIYDLYVKTGPKFESKMESKAIEGNVAQPFLWYVRHKIEQGMNGTYDPTDPNLLHIEFVIDKREGCIFKTDDKPEGIMYLADMQTGQGAQLIRKSKESSLMEGEPEKMVEESVIAGSEFGVYKVPQQIKIKRDPFLEMLFTINPYLNGSMIDSFNATELLRGRVEMWKTMLVGAACLIFGLLIGMGM